MKESLLKLAKLLTEDEKFLQEFSALKSVDEQYDFAQKKVSGYTKEEFVDFLDELEKSYELKSDISPEEMEKVSGGANRNKVAAAAMLALSAVGSVAPMLTGAMRPAVPYGSEYDDDESMHYGQIYDFETSRIGGPAVSVGASAVMRAYAEDINTFKFHLNDNKLDTFSSAEACNNDKTLRKDEVVRIKNLSNDINTKSEILNTCISTYNKEKDMGINWVHCPKGTRAYTCTSYILEDTPQIRALLDSKSNIRGEGHKARIIKWLLNQFRDGYYLYFVGDDLCLGKGSESINLIKEAGSYATNKEVDTQVKDVQNFITELTWRLNRARVVGLSLRQAAYDLRNTIDVDDVGKWIMRENKETPVQGGDVNDKSTGFYQKWLQGTDSQLKFMNYVNCSDKGVYRVQCSNQLGEIKKDVGSKVRTIEYLKNFVNESDVNWEKIKVGIRRQSAWKFKIKDDKKSGFVSRARSGDAYAQVLLWLNARFGQGCYLWPDGDHFVLYNDGNGKFDNLYGSSFTRFVRESLKVEPVSDRDYSGAITQISRTCNLHRAISGALYANGMNVEANAVMAGTA